MMLGLGAFRDFSFNSRSSSMLGPQAAAQQPEAVRVQYIVCIYMYVHINKYK